MPDVNGVHAKRYETIFSVFLAALAFLWRDNPNLEYPQILYLFLALLGLNLAAGMALRLWPRRPGLSAAIALANCGVITAALRYSGGADSNLWALYLLPIFTAGLLLGAREAAWITGGAVAFNAAFLLHEAGSWRDAELFLLALKTGIFILAAAVTSTASQNHQVAVRALEEKNDELEKAKPLAEMGMLSSGVAHDLKSPLSVILGTLEMMLAREDLPSETRAQLERVGSAARHCRDIVVSVLSLGGRGRREFEEKTIEQVVGAALYVYGPSLAQSGIAVECSYEPGLPKVSVCTYEVQRLLLNLLANARDAMPSGGQVRIRAQETRIPIAGAAACVRLVVEDTGPGFTESGLSNLFKPFATTKGEGTGLGLYLCRLIAMDHGGSLRADNAPGGGARFELLLPGCRSGVAV